MYFPASASSSRANLSVPASRLDSLLHVKLIRSCKNIFQTVSFVQREIIIKAILETISQGKETGTLLMRKEKQLAPSSYCTAYQFDEKQGIEE